MDEPADLTDPHTWLQVAETKLEHARRIFEVGLYDDAISRAYYAMFYAAKGALLTEGLDLRKHSSVVAKFRELQEDKSCRAAPVKNGRVGVIWAQ